MFRVHIRARKRQRKLIGYKAQARFEDGLYLVERPDKSWSPLGSNESIIAVWGFENRAGKFFEGWLRGFRLSGEVLNG